MRYLIPLLLLISCGPINDLYMPAVYHDAGFSPVLAEFRQDATDRGIPLDRWDQLRVVKWVDHLPEERLGLCTRQGIQSEDIAKYGGYWTEIRVHHQISNQPPILLKALLYHELGHCVLDLNHTTQYPYRLMSPNAESDTWIAANWISLVDDLFQSATSN